MRFVRVISFILALGCASGGLSQTVDTIERSFTVSGVPELYVRNEDGRTQITAHGGAGVEVRATKEVMHARDAAEAEEMAAEVDVRIEQQGQRISVTTHYPERRWRFWRDAHVLVHLEIRAPRRSDIDVGSEDGNIGIEGFEGDVTVLVEDGDLRVSDCAGRLDITAEDGDVDLEGIRGEVSAELEDGDLTVSGTLSVLRAETEDGTVDVQVLPDSAMEADWSVRAEDGRIRLELPEGFAADLDVRVDDGSIEIDQPVTQGKFSKRQLTTQLNGGGHTLRLRSSDGSVRITQS